MGHVLFPVVDVYAVVLTPLDLTVPVDLVSVESGIQHYQDD